MRWFLSSILLIAVTALLTACMTDTPLSELEQYEPVPSLSPAEVVGIQLRALRNNDAANRGIEIAFRFASPHNRETTGPLSRFIRLFDTVGFSPMLEAEEVLFLTPQGGEDYFVQPVRLTDGNGEESLFLFLLAKQFDPPYEECWMVEGVRPVVPELEGEGLEPPAVPPLKELSPSEGIISA